MSVTTIKSICKFGACEPQCGMEFDIENGKITQVRPDPTHPFSRGYVCKKGMAIPEYQNDPDRLLSPEINKNGDFEKIEWKVATDDIGHKLRQIRDQYGPSSIATYWGNAADSSAMIGANTLCSALGSPNSMNVLSLEYTDRGAVAERLFGDQTIIIQPDADSTDFALLLGTNPLVTQGMTLLQRRPRIAGDLKNIRQRGGKVVVVDPRVTETTKVSDQHLMIQPGTDLFLLLGMIKRIIEADNFNQDYLQNHCTGFDWWKTFVSGFSLESIASITGIHELQITRLADEFSGAKKAFITTRVGVQTSHNTALTEWAVQTLNVITGRVGKEGGLFFNPGAINNTDLVHLFTKKKNPAASRVGGYPQIFGGPPASVFADDVLSEDANRIRALIVVAGNPLISFPNSAKVEQALKKLDLLVTIDIYRSDTGALAHYNLPATTLYEKGGFHFLTQPFDPVPHAEWRKKLVEPTGQARPEWDIFRDISRAAKVPFLNNTLISGLDKCLSWFGKNFTEEHLAKALLISPFAMKKLSLKKLKKSEHGISVGQLQKEAFFTQHIRTLDKKVQLAPDDFCQAIHAVLKNPPIPTKSWPFSLISGGRRLSTFNTWTKNIPSLMKNTDENVATMHTEDAIKMNIKEGDMIEITTASGFIKLKAKPSDLIRPGVVMVQQFWGHKFDSSQTLAKQKPGVNVNYLHSDQALCQFTGMPVFNGTPCRITAP
tara:strand:- start:18408 stop:20555 length:2148 start_codon:yes stop_codon:yes gene_type:complete